MDKESNQNPPLDDYRFNLGKKDNVVIFQFYKLGKDSSR